MFLPKIKFKPMSLEENIDIIKWAYFENNESLSVHDFTIKYFNELADLDSSLTQNEIYKIIEEVVTNNYYKCKDKILEQTKKYSLLWNDYNDKYFNSLSLYFGVDWPNNINEIIATVGLIPVFPRNLDSFSFSVSIDVNEIQLLELCAHETLHFLWFEKWKQIHPETPRQEFDSPYLVWQYSEMVTDPILNNKPFSEMFGFVEHGYDSFYEIKDNGNKLMDNLRDIYSKDTNIEEKINQGFEYVNKVLNKKEDIKSMKK